MLTVLIIVHIKVLGRAYTAGGHAVYIHAFINYLFGEGSCHSNYGALSCRLMYHLCNSVNTGNGSNIYDFSVTVFKHF